MTLIGRTLLSRYQVTQQIGTGGFGDTYLAVDLALPGQPQCVVKHLSPKDTSPQVLTVAQRLFDQEAQLLHRLGEHSQIPRLYAHFNDQGEFYFVQELIEGKDLSHELQPGQQWSEEKTVKLLSDILEVLVVVHQENVIHRDLKPTNIMRRNSDEKIILIDFGAVKEIQGIEVNAQGQTHLTVSIGSPGYMPSEQAQGRPKFASDIYAVGIIGIQALTGLKPSQFPRDQKTDEILWRNHANVSDELAEILNKMVQERLSDRYSNASEALTSLTSLLTQSNNFSTANTHRLTTVNISQSAATTPISTPPFRQSVTQSIKSSLGGIITVIFFVGGVYITLENLRSPSNSLKTDYTELQNLLSQKQWKEADIETEKVMLKIANREAEGWIDANAIESLSCADLRELDQVWMKYSEGKFGLSIQKEIYLETGNPLGKFQESSYHKFGDRIGWRKNGDWLEYSDLTFDENALRGQFPTCKNAAQKFSGCRWPLYWLFARAETCQL
ncbi:serine/threonine-protein kinase [Lyngbya sp. PCC 8106]|uniref:serine/threonine-protein kinase n=1 Tax=Lyngbya sp. (strain PCC 8106) TaxID=313612 RepID=UPI0000EAA374|nr:serine/threonine-protein kinase [Lyngbya sp. PCC 8106]EAW35421.1 Serine/Threonine protein kinase [Lyngbya sp. PCC 8106]